MVLSKPCLIVSLQNIYLHKGALIIWKLWCIGFIATLGSIHTEATLVATPYDWSVLCIWSYGWNGFKRTEQIWMISMSYLFQLAGWFPPCHLQVLSPIWRISTKREIPLDHIVVKELHSACRILNSGMFTFLTRLELGLFHMWEYMYGVDRIKVHPIVTYLWMESNGEWEHKVYCYFPFDFLLRWANYSVSATIIVCYLVG